jgi:plastocyanin
LVFWAGYSASDPASVGAGKSLAFANGEVKTVLINHFKYQPDTLAVHVGDTVEWKNIDIVPHTATTAGKKSFDSGRIATGASRRFTFNRKGTYDYECTLHPNMKAKLVVQ